MGADDIEEIRSQARRNEDLQLEREGYQIREKLFEAAGNNNSKAFGASMVDLMDRFKGDPRPTLNDLLPLLQHENESIAGVVASAFLRSGIATDKATATLLKIMSRPGPLVVPASEEEPRDIRLGIASVLSMYPSEEISNAVWDLYQRTKDETLFDELLRLKNPNLPGEIIPRLGKTGAVFDYLWIISEYKIQEAREPLMKFYQNEYFMRKGEGRKRGATLWGLWRVTGERKYYEEFMAGGGAGAAARFANEGTLEAKQRLLSLLQGDSHTERDLIVMALHLKYDDPPELKEYLRNIYLSGKGSPISADLLYRLTSRIDDPDLHAVAEKAFSGSGGPAMWRQYGVYRKGWAIPEWMGGSLEIR